MAKITYDVSGDIPETVPAPVGWYRAEVVSAEEGDSKTSGNPMVTVVFRLTHDASGKKLSDDDYWPVRQYLMIADDRPYAKRNIREFVTALGAKLKGTLDTNKVKGAKVQLKLKADTDQDGEYQPRIAKITKLGESTGDDGPPLAEPETNGAEPEAAEPEPEAEADNGALDLDAMDRAALKALIAEEELEITVYKGWTDDQIRDAIAEAMGGGEEGEPEEPDEPEEEPAEPDEPEEPAAAAEEDGYEGMSRDDLLAELKERKLPTGGAKSILIQRLRADDAASPF